MSELLNTEHPPPTSLLIWSSTYWHLLTSDHKTKNAEHSDVASDIYVKKQTNKKNEIVTMESNKYPALYGNFSK